MQVIGLIGLKGAGKDTAASVFEVNGWRNMKFATPMKAMLQALVVSQGGTMDHAVRLTDGDLKEEPSDFLGGNTPRFAMQTIGTEWGRNIMGLHFWRDRLIQAGSQLHPNPAGVVITDARFPNEFETVRKLGGELYRIDRPELTKAAKLAREKGELHESECHVLDVEVDGELRNVFDSALAFRGSVHEAFKDRL